MTVDRHGDVFDIRMQFIVDASPARVFAALQDYRAVPTYNPEVREMKVTPTAVAGQVLVYSVVHSCVLIFCKTLHQKQRVTAVVTPHGGRLDVQLLPGGDFKQGRARWVVAPCQRGSASTCVDAVLHLVTGFWVPPLIGSWIMRRKMEDEAAVTGAGLEQLARESARPP